MLRLSRTDGSNLDPGFSGRIGLAASGHLHLSTGTVSFEISDEVTESFLTNIVYTALRPGVAGLRATYADATAEVEVLISEGVVE